MHQTERESIAVLKRNFHEEISLLSLLEESILVEPRYKTALKEIEAHLRAAILVLECYTFSEEEREGRLDRPLYFSPR